VKKQIAPSPLCHDGREGQIEEWLIKGVSFGCGDGSRRGFGSAFQSKCWTTMPESLKPCLPVFLHPLAEIRLDGHALTKYNKQIVF